MIDEAEHARLAPIAERLARAIKAADVPEQDLSDLLMTEALFAATRRFGTRYVARHLFVVAHAIALDADKIDADALLEKTLSNRPH